METNQKITEWFGRCWHDWRSMGPGWGYRCGHCGETSSVGRNTDYTASPSACLAIIDALAERGYRVTTRSDNGDPKVTATVWIPNEYGDTTQANADTLPMAVALAVETLIDNERALGPVDFDAIEGEATTVDKDA